MTLAEFLRRCEMAYLKHLVERIGHRGEASGVLGISRKNLWEKLRRLGLGELPTTPESLLQLAKIHGLPVDKTRELLARNVLGPSRFAA